MKFLWIIVCGILWTHTVFAGNNVFCKNRDSSESFCVMAADAMYNGYIEGYTKTLRKYREEDMVDEDMVFEEAKDLIPYDIFYSAFQTCGEISPDMKRAQRCILKELQKYVLTKPKREL